MNKIKIITIITLVACILPTLNLRAQTNITHGYQTFLEDGIMLEALTFPSDGWDSLNETNWSNSNFTTANTWLYNYPASNGSSWGYWVKPDLSNLRILNHPQYDVLTTVQYGDEQSISSGLSTLASTISTLKGYYPDQLVYTNQGIGSSGYTTSTFSLPTLMNYTQTVQPDILNFTEYPFRWLGTGYVHDYDGGSPTTMYVHMEMYRKAGLAGLSGDGSDPIPVGMYVQQYAQLNSSSVNDDEPSQSQMNLQTFTAWAFGFRKTTSFVYETPSHDTSMDSVLFDGTGDDTPSSKFNGVAEMNRQSLNLSDGLVRLISTDVRMQMGQNKDSGSTVTNDLPSGITAFGASGSVDSYMTGVTATNLGSCNNGLAGDVVIGYYNPIDASLVEEGAEDDVYFMLVNGLTDAAGDGEDCRQNIHLEFDLSGTEITQLLRLNRDTGEVEVVSLTAEGNGIYSMDLLLDGGVGDLFKYDTGTAFVPEPASMTALLFALFVLIRRKNSFR